MPLAAEPEAAWRAYRSELYRFVRARVEDEAAAEDLVHDVLLRAYSQRDTLRGCRHPRGAGGQPIGVTGKPFPVATQGQVAVVKPIGARAKAIVASAKPIVAASKSIVASGKPMVESGWL